jgi:hypothetical protein
MSLFAQLDMTYPSDDLSLANTSSESKVVVF